MARRNKMEITADEMKKSIQKIYDLLDGVSPLDYDCGKLCGEICCVYDESEEHEAVGLFLLPGEELMYEDNDSFNLYAVDSKEVDFPPSWKEDVFMVECINPPRCDRSIRPIQCRTFPLIAHISKDRKLHLILDENEIPYECPIMKDNIRLNEDFIKVTYKVWEILIQNPLVYDLVSFDSRRRDNRKKGYKIVI